MLIGFVIAVKGAPLRALFLADKPGHEKPDWTFNMLIGHGVRSCLEYANVDLGSEETEQDVAVAAAVDFAAGREGEVSGEVN